MNAQCPKCGYGFSWLEKRRLSSSKPTPCPHCQAALLKDPVSAKLMNGGLLLVFLPQIALQLLSFWKRVYHVTIPDFIEIPLALLITMPSLALGFYYVIKGVMHGRLIVASDESGVSN